MYVSCTCKVKCLHCEREFSIWDESTACELIEEGDHVFNCPSCRELFMVEVSIQYQHVSRLLTEEEIEDLT